MSVDEENQLLCEKLLGWEPSDIHAGFWHTSTDEVVQGTPTFLTGDGMLLLLEALYLRSLRVSVDLYPSGIWRVRIAPWQEGEATENGSLVVAVRAATLAHIQAQP